MKFCNINLVDKNNYWQFFFESLEEFKFRAETIKNTRIFNPDLLTDGSDGEDLCELDKVLSDSIISE